MRKNAGAVIIILAAVLVLAMVLPGLFQGSGSTTTSNNKYWNAVVATANGRKITRLEYEREYISQLQLRSQLGGVRYDQLDKLRSSVLDMVIDKELILAEAAKEKINLSKEVIDAEYEKQKESVSAGSAENWTSFLNNWAFTEATFRTYVAENTLYDTYTALKAEFTAVTDAEITAEFNRRKASNANLVLEDVQEEIKNTLEYERRRTAINDLLAKVRKQADEAGKIEVKDARVLGYRSYETGEFDSSINYYKAALKESEQDPYLWCSLAMAQAKKGAYEDSMVSIGKAMDLGEDFTIYLTRAEINAMQKLDDAAYADFESAIKLAGTNLGVLQTINFVIEELKEGGYDTAKINERFMQAVTEALKAQETSSTGGTTTP
jgi:tetratricopeptide (TPR) repeat protein